MSPPRAAGSRPILSRLLIHFVGRWTVTIDRHIRTSPQVSLLQLFSAEQCDALVAEAEEIAKTQDWTDRGASLPTRDQPLKRFSAATQELFQQKLVHDLLPFLKRSQPERFKGMNQIPTGPFVVKYSADDGGQRSLKRHKDGKWPLCR